jgi:integrase
LDAVLEQALWKWVEKRGPQGGPLFPASMRKPEKHIGTDQIYSTFHTAARRAGVQREDPRPKGKGHGMKKWHISPHSFRAGCIVEMFGQHIPVDQIKKFIHHESAATTIRYTDRAAVNLEPINTAMHGVVEQTLHRHQ